MTSKEIRQQFLDFFASKGHTVVDSSPVVPLDDPTLMFTNAGMNQFKDVFLATGSRAYTRAADTQKCIRAGGKHNDLDDVGQDTYHHTFFEMLGNWSFGDYFKEEAICWAWELLTGVWGIDKARLHATYFEGDDSEGLAPDTEAAALWRTGTDIEPSHIHPGNKKDNFWEMGETGPCGPCSEIHIDLTPDKSGASLVNAGDPRVIELWNLVFIQFNRANDGKLSPLPARHVDTGMGFERLCAVLQGMATNRLGAVTNYDTDVFTKLFDAIREVTGAPVYTGTLPGSDDATERRSAEREVRASAGTIPSSAQVMIDVSYRVVADHLRCLTFAITDGAMPSNEGRGYVLRRILRRAVRYGRQYMNMHEPFLCRLVTPLVDLMGEAFPELRTAHGGKNIAHIEEILRDEEESFLKTLDRGIRLFQEAADHARRRHHGKITGEDAFKLHDTYGFPIDLTELMAEEYGLTIDFAEYERLMDEAKSKSRHVSAGVAHVRMEAVPASVTLSIPGCDDSPKYIGTEHTAKVVGWLGDSGDLVTAPPLSVGQEARLLLESTCFYAEQGGQVGDRGFVQTDTGRMEVLDTQRIQELVLHLGVVREGEIATNQSVSCHVDVTRAKTTQNHTSTHIMNWALREVLCPAEERAQPHVRQKGSLVDPEKTRFDFSHNKPLTDEELARIEELCNEQIAANFPVYTDDVDQAKAREINTLRAVFGEKYPDVVRVVSIGAPITEDQAKASGKQDWLLQSPTNPEWMKYSVEFCGGTHLNHSSEADRFVLTAEEGVAKGIRRVVGISGEVAKEADARGQAMLAAVRALAGEPADQDADFSTRVAAFSQQLADAVIPLRVRREIQSILADVQRAAKEQQKQAAADAGGAVKDKVAALFAQAEEIGGVTVVVGEVPPAGVDALRDAIDWVRNKTEASAVLLVSRDGDKVSMIAGMSKAVVNKGVKAGDLIKEIAPLVGGRGGGRPDMAQGGGPDVSGITQALDRAIHWIREGIA